MRRMVLNLLYEGRGKRFLHGEGRDTGKSFFRLTFKGKNARNNRLFVIFAVAIFPPSVLFVWLVSSHAQLHDAPTHTVYFKSSFIHGYFNSSTTGKHNALLDVGQGDETALLSRQLLEEYGLEEEADVLANSGIRREDDLRFVSDELIKGLPLSVLSKAKLKEFANAFNKETEVVEKNAGRPSGKEDELKGLREQLVDLQAENAALKAHGCGEGGAENLTSITGNSMPVDNNEADTTDGHPLFELKSDVDKKTSETNIYSFQKFNIYSFQKFMQTAPLCDVKQEEDIEFTLAIQLSYSRLWIMEHHCKRWGNNHISLAVAVKEESEKEETGHRLFDMGCNQKITVSFVDVSSLKDYPVNRLRNLALSHVKTTHSITMDGDLLVSPNLHEALLAHRAVLASDNKAALVIPAFEVRNVCEPKSNTDSTWCRKLHVSMVPNTKKQLLQSYAPPVKYKTWESNANYMQFLDITWKYAHSTTCPSSWPNQSASELFPVTCVTSDWYDPYLAIRYCRDTPPFQEAFAGFGENKVTWMKQVRRAGFRLFRIGDGFTIHVPHLKSPAWFNRKKKKMNARIKQSFQWWMKANVKSEHRMPLCEKKTCEDGGGAQRISSHNPLYSSRSALFIS